MKRWLVVIALGVAAVTVARDLHPIEADSPDVTISEFMAANSSTVFVNGATPDWIELWNRSGDAVDLTGWHLTDDDDDPRKWSFPEGSTVPAGGHVLVYADNAPTNTRPWHTNFALAAGGDYLALTTASGIVVSEYRDEYPAQRSDISYGIGTGGSIGFLRAPTPGAGNTELADGVAATPTISHPGGWVTEHQTVTLSTATDDASIFFTTDGSTPAADNGTLYTAPIGVARTTTLRAVAVRRGWFHSGIAAATYLVMDDVLAQQGTPQGWPTGDVNGQRYDYGFDQSMVAERRTEIEAALTSIPTLSVVTDQANLTDPATGIYANPGAHGAEWERSASLQLIDPGGGGFQLTGGVQIKGGWSRRAENPKHSFRLTFGSQYDGELSYDVFGTSLHPGTTDVFSELDLRSEQNVSWHQGDAGQTFLRDVWVRDSQAALGEPSTRSRWVHVFLNGQYWGLYMLKDRPTAGHATLLWGGDPDGYDVLRTGGAFTYDVQSGDGNEWLLLWGTIADSVVTDGEYATIDELVDLRNLADVQLLHATAGNGDASPTGAEGDLVANNWYAVAGNGQPFRFFADDAEFSLGATSHLVDVDRSGPFPLGTANPRWDAEHFNPGWLHAVLLQQRGEYRALIRERAEVLLADAGPLGTSSSTARWMARQREVEPLVDAEAARWGDAGGIAYDSDTWRTEVQWVLREWFPARPAIVRAQLAAKGLGSTAT